MRKCAIICILLVLAAGLNATAAVRVTNLFMEKNSQFTEFTIACDRDFEYQHQIVEAKGDKPFRIVVDVLDAVHRLPQWDFANIPKSSITKIRTSQYSVEPREIVRVVLDVKGVLTYKVKKEDNKLVLFVNTPGDPKIERWVAAPNEPDWPIMAEENNQPLIFDETEQPPAIDSQKENWQTVAARPGNEASAPLVDKSKPEQKPQLATEPPRYVEDLSDFNNLLVEKGADPSQVKQSEAKKATEPDAKPTVNDPLKQLDSANLMPQTPSMVPDTKSLESEVLPEPKAQKSGLPETKVSAEPELAQQDEQNDTDANSAQSIREKYAARMQGGTFDESGAMTNMTTDEKPVLDKVDRIRQKYKKGISFVADDEDAQRLAAQHEQERQAAEQSQDQVPRFYDEFIPERQVVVYASDGQRDPFAPLVDLADEMSEKSDLPDVATLRLVGVLQEEENSRALFEDYNGYAYIMETGARVRNGFLASISEDHVVFQIRQYGWSRQVAVQLEDES